MGGAVRARRRGRYSRPTPASTELNRHGWTRPSMHPDSTEAEPASSSCGRALRARCARARPKSAAGAQAQPHGMPTRGRPGTNSSPARIRAPPAADLHVRGPSVSWPRRRIGEVRKTRARAISEVKCARHAKLLFIYTPSYILRSETQAATTIMVCDAVSVCVTVHAVPTCMHTNCQIYKQFSVHFNSRNY
jgi:hypothetical protein